MCVPRKRGKEGNPDALEDRRLRGIALLRKGKSQSEVARELDVSRQAVHTWKNTYEESGRNALKSRKRPGRPPRLDNAARRKLAKILVKGAEAYGFENDVWTGERVASVIHKEFGVTYHPQHVTKLLHKLGFSWQKPKVRAIERDEERIKEWVQEDWPRIKKGRPGSAR